MIRNWITQTLVLLTILIPFKSSAAPAWKQQVQNLVQNGSVLAVGESGDILYSLNADRRFVPASTLKVATALAALKILGTDYRFKTEFLQDGSGNLYIKGYGDPFLISEEIAQIALRLKAAGLSKVNNMILDTSFFDPNIQIGGLTGSLNPYDAYNGALLANFNTIYIVKSGSGEVRSAEEQTPVTEITKTLAQRAPVGKSRINVAVHKREAPLYMGYLLKEFLLKQGVPVTGTISSGSVSPQSKKILSYESSKNLSEVLKAGLKYSQNLIMNQIFLTMGTAKMGAPATVPKAKQVFNDFLKNSLGLQGIQVHEGSGISRQNSVTALEMDKILVNFFPHYRLLPIKKGMWVKTGTLRGVSTLVGYFRSQTQGWVRFTILLNQAAGNRDRIAKLLKENL